MTKKPHLITFNRIGESQIGFISVADAEENVPFTIKRVFWTYFTPESITRGRHAHYKTEQVLVAVTGKIIVTVENAFGEKEKFVLEEPNKGVYLPPNVWHVMEYSHNAVQMVFASTEYNEKDYIRDYETFKKVYNDS